MATRSVPMVLLAEMVDGQEGDLFVLLSGKEELTTRDGKPYYKVSFRDKAREVSFPIWNDSPLAPEVRAQWTPGAFYKLRATFRDTNYGPQLEIRKAREVVDDDATDGFDPLMCQPQSRFAPDEMFAELLEIIEDKIRDPALAELVRDMLTENRESFASFPAATANHHAYASGLLEHTLSVVRSCLYLADKYAEYYPELDPPLAVDVVVAGAVLHDIGKLREYSIEPQGAEYSAAGHLIGHILQGRDMLREAAEGRDLDPETLLRLEHVIVSHQRLPEWGSPKPPITPEAMIVHYADDLDAKYHMMVAALENDTNDGPVTSRKNTLYQRVFRGLT